MVATVVPVRSASAPILNVAIPLFLVEPQVTSGGTGHALREQSLDRTGDSHARDQPLLQPAHTGCGCAKQQRPMARRPATVAAWPWREPAVFNALGVTKNRAGAPRV